LKIRKSTESERHQILNIHNKAFGEGKGSVIAKLVDDLFDDKTAKPIFSLVAAENEKLVGHVMFTKVTIAGAENSTAAQILAPLAVLPDKQNRGIGEQLINEGLRQLRENGTVLCFVLGHPGYYPRCGFIPAGKHGYEAPYPIPEEHADAWMVQALNGEDLSPYSGKVQCSEVLNQPQHWRE